MKYISTILLCIILCTLIISCDTGASHSNYLNTQSATAASPSFDPQIISSPKEIQTVIYKGSSSAYNLIGADGNYMTGQDGNYITVPQIDWTFTIGTDNTIKLSQYNTQNGSTALYNGVYESSRNGKTIVLKCDFVESSNSKYPSKPSYKLVIDTTSQIGKCIGTSFTGEPDFVISVNGNHLEHAVPSNLGTANESINLKTEIVCDDMTSYEMGYSAAKQQVGNGILTDCGQMWDNIHSDDDGLTYHCFCEGWNKYVKEH